MFFVLRWSISFTLVATGNRTQDKAHYSTLNCRAVFPIAPQGQSLIIIISLLITENDDKNANEPIKTKRTLKRANTEAVTGCGGESRQFMTKSSNNKDFISKDEARRRMMSWRKTTSLRYSSTTNPYHSVNTKKWLLFFRQTNCTQMWQLCAAMMSWVLRWVELVVY